MFSQRVLLLTCVCVCLIYFCSESCAQELVQQDTGDTAEMLIRLQSDVPQVRATAAIELGNRRVASETVVQALARTLTDPVPRVRRAAMVGLQRIGPMPQFILPSLTRLLADPDPAVAAQAARLLALQGERVVPLMIEALANEDARYWASLVLSSLGERARAAVPALIAVLNTEEPEVRREVIMALGAIGPEARAAMPALLEVMKSDDPAIVLAGTYSLGNMGPAAQLATPILREQMETEDPFLMAATAWALASLNPEDTSLQTQMISILVRTLALPDNPSAREAAARALVELRPDPNLLLPELADLVSNSPPEVLRDAMQAFVAVGPPAVPAMIRLLQDEQARPLAARVLGQIGPEAAGAVPSLATALETSNPEARREILFALAAIGPAAEPAVPQMVPFVSSELPQVRYTAIYALGELGSAAAEALPALQANLRSEDPFVRFTSAWGMIRIAPEDPSVVAVAIPHLIAALEHERPFVRVEAASALGRIGRAARAAIPTLRDAAAADPNDLVRQTAAEALRRIGG